MSNANNAIVQYSDDKMVQLEAKAAASKVDLLISELLTAEARLENDYAKLGLLLLDVHKNLYWKYVGFTSFGEYMRDLSDKYKRGRSQLYQYFSTVRILEPYVSTDQLSDMGIAKATELSKSVKRNGFPPTPEVIEQAVNSEVTAASLRKILFEADNIIDVKDGTWLDQQGFYVTDDERLVISSADEAALRADPAVPVDAPDWVKRKEARLRQAMEFLGSHPSA